SFQMSIRNVHLKSEDQSTTMEMNAFCRAWRITAHRCNDGVFVSLYYVDSCHSHIAHWLPPFSVSLKADVLDNLEWRSVEIKPVSHVRMGEWEIAATDEWVSLTIEMDADQWYDEKVFPRLSSATPSSDVVFVIDNEEIHSNTAKLTAASPLFAMMFESTVREENSERIFLEGVDYNEHLAFFLVLHRDKYRITDKNVAAITRLADKYDTPDVLFQCHSFLVRSSSLPSIDKLRLAELTRNENCIDEMITRIEDWDRVSGEESFTLLSDSTRIKVLERAVMLMNLKLEKVVYSCSGGCRSRINQIDFSVFH
ncbi:hypothetical protein PFISCL1PPCAC_20067, partial [Pristionchus fissidentatus]